MSRVLLLNPFAAPHKIVSWETAITLVYLNKAVVLEEYDEEIRSPSTTIRMPAVVQLTKPLASMKRGVKFSRINVFTRDNFRCQYCGERKAMKDLNYDHVLPRRLGGKTIWENIVSSCYPCNDRKGMRTPEQAGMKLIKRPYRPRTLPMSYLQIDRRTIPEVWGPYCQLQGVEEDRSGLFLMTGTGH